MSETPEHHHFEDSDTEHAGQNTHDTSDLWIVPYADFMSVLMIFFLLMFAFAYSSKSEKRYDKMITSIQQEMGGKVNKELLDKMLEEERADQVVSKLDDMVDKQRLKDYVTINTDAQRIKVIFKNPILFDTGQVELKPEAFGILHTVATILKAVDSDIIVEGHTDNIPTHGRFTSNWELSSARALEVVRYFVYSEDVPPQRFATAGYGEFRPIASNDTQDGKSQNRRIEINILRK
jgi:chemotaxis protein MotB